jgi:hypothetical protein
MWLTSYRLAPAAYTNDCLPASNNAAGLIFPQFVAIEKMISES